MPKYSRCCFSLLAPTLLLTGCGDIPVTSANGNIAVGLACQSSSECKTGSLCHGNICRLSCEVDNDCDIENYHCENSVCLPGKATVCGNGILELGETCDDGNRTAGDGCNANCGIEQGWRCVSQAPIDPNSVCNRTQGNCLGNFTGDNCDQCKDKFAGENCDQCADSRFIGPNCNQCADSHFTGPNCDQCTDRFIGTNCDQCPDRFTGENCDQCADSRFTGPNCYQCSDSHFTGSNCDECADRFTGVNCDECADSRYTGTDCNQCKAIDENSMADIECNVYDTVVINDKTWMAENLRNSSIEHYSANNDSKNDDTYGYLYTWENAINACPEGWRLPTSSEFLDLIGATSIGKFFRTRAIQDLSWDAYATNITGFSALPAGYCSDYGCGSVRNGAYFWSFTPNGSSSAYVLVVGSYYGEVYSADVTSAYSVRCVKD